MNHLGRELSGRDWSLVCSGLKPIRPMTPEEKAREYERQRCEAEWINRHPFRFLLKFALALSLLIFSLWLAHRNWVNAFRSPPGHSTLRASPSPSALALERPSIEVC